MADMIKLPIKLTPEYGDLPLPQYATVNSAGLDLLAVIQEDLVLKPLQRLLIPTGICLQLPDGYEAQVRPRSGLALKYGITLLNSPGTIDADYRGEIKVIVVNLSQDDFLIKPGMRIAQMVVAQVSQGYLQIVTELDDTQRGSGGFGHSGV